MGFDELIDPGHESQITEALFAFADQTRFEAWVDLAIAESPPRTRLVAQTAADFLKDRQEFLRMLGVDFLDEGTGS